MSGMLDRLSQSGQTAASSRSAIGRRTSNTPRQSLQKYSYTGMRTAYRGRVGGASRRANGDLTGEHPFATLIDMRSLDLLLPLDDGAAGELARQRIDHLRGLAGISPGDLVRLGRAFPTLATIYAAPEAKLAGVIGPVAAARIRWFLDAPLDTRLLSSPAPAATQAVRAA